MGTVLEQQCADALSWHERRLEASKRFSDNAKQGVYPGPRVDKSPVKSVTFDSGLTEEQKQNLPF